MGRLTSQLQLISVAFEHSVLRVREIYALVNVVFCIAVYGPYSHTNHKFPIYATRYVQTQLKSTVVL